MKNLFSEHGALFIGSSVLIGLHAFIVYVLPEIAPDRWVFLRRSWGFHFWVFYPGWVAVCLYAGAFAVAIPKVNRTVAKWIHDVLVLIPKDIRHKRVFYGVLCLLCWGIFWIGRQKYGLLGDGYVRASDVVAGRLASEGIGSLHLLFLLQGLFGEWDNKGVLVLQLFSVFWGGLYIILVCLWANLLCKRLYEKLFCAGLMVFVGPVQYFFGYIETYAPLPVFAIGFLLSGISTLQDNKLPLWATGWFVAGTFMHMLLVVFLPALLYLWASYFEYQFSLFRRWRVVLWSLFVVCSVLLMSAVSQQYAHFFLPLYSSPEYPYAIFSLWHVWEWINAQVLSAPMGWPLLFLFGVTRSRALCREMGFLSASVLGAVAGLFVIDPVLGSRDWDILCFSGIPLMGLATYAIYSGDIDKHLRHYASVFSLVCAVLLIVPWVHINHTDRSIARVIQILDGDPGLYYQSHPVEMTLGLGFLTAGLDSLAMTYFKQGLQKYPSDPRMPFNVGSMYYSRGDIGAAVSFYLLSLDTLPNYPSAQKQLVRILSDDVKNQAAIQSIRQYFQTQEDGSNASGEGFADILNRLGLYAYSVEQLDEALKIWHQGYQIDTLNITFLNNLGAAYYEKGNMESAASCWEKAYRFFPEDEDIALNLAKLYQAQGDPDRAAQIFRKALVISPENQALLDALDKLQVDAQ